MVPVSSVPAPRPKRSKAHVVIAMPVYGGMMRLECTRSLLHAFGRPRDDGHEAGWITNSLSSIRRARNELATNFLGIPGATHLLWIDADLSFPADAVPRLLAHDVDVVAGLYPMKQFPLHYPFTLRQTSTGARVYWIQALSRPNSSPAASCSSSREVYLALMEAFPERASPLGPRRHGADGPTFRTFDFYQELVDDGLVLPEDYSFCASWRSIGGTVWADLSIRLTHHGMHSFTGDPMSLIAPAMQAGEAV